jgi:hypothetical protein
MHNRALKKTVRELLLAQKDMGAVLEHLYKMKLRRVINPLFSFFYSGDERLRWHAITAAGAVISKMADRQIEDARIMMRRLMWNLNDESGGIGWGSPEAMGAAMAGNARLAKEYAAILVSYLNPDGNFLEHENLQSGVLWGIGRLAGSRPQMAASAAPFLEPFLSAPIPLHRGLAAWGARALETVTTVKIPAAIYADETIVRLYSGHSFHDLPIRQLAAGGPEWVDKSD